MRFMKYVKKGVDYYIELEGEKPFSMWNFWNGQLLYHDRFANFANQEKQQI